MSRITKSDALMELGIMAVGFALGAIAAYLFPFICLLFVPVFSGWFAGGGMTNSALLSSRQAASFGIGANGAATFVMTFTLGWDRAYQEWILYSLLGTMTIFWVSYAGMRWLHQSSGQPTPDR